MTRDYDNRSRIPSSARCIVPLPFLSWHSRSTAGLIPHPGVYLTLCFVFSIFSPLASLFSSILHPLPSPLPSRAFRVFLSPPPLRLCSDSRVRLSDTTCARYSFIIFYFIHIPRTLGVRHSSTLYFYLVLAANPESLRSLERLCSFLLLDVNRICYIRLFIIIRKRVLLSYIL